ncbi:MAG: hypothetical protein IJL66_03000 [Lachnospiraceae bacterium]|nr:hypothetical protein [Lachnospiraceae bacterium]
MKFRFELEKMTVKKNAKLPREEKADIISYLSSLQLEAPEEKKAIRLLSAQLNGRLSKDSEGSEALITLPDYGGCQLLVRAVRAS